MQRILKQDRETRVSDSAPSPVRDDGQLEHQLPVINVIFNWLLCVLIPLARSDYVQSSLNCKQFMILYPVVLGTSDPIKLALLHF